jgi:hypothetical protein
VFENVDSSRCGDDGKAAPHIPQNFCCEGFSAEHSPQVCNDCSASEATGMEETGIGSALKAFTSRIGSCERT